MATQTERVKNILTATYQQDKIEGVRAALFANSIGMYGADNLYTITSYGLIDIPTDPWRYAENMVMRLGDSLKVLAYGPPPVYPVTPSDELVEEIATGKYAVTEVLYGTTVWLYHDGSRWRVSTRRCPDVRAVHYEHKDENTIGDYFFHALHVELVRLFGGSKAAAADPPTEKIGELPPIVNQFLSEIDKNATYSFTFNAKGFHVYAPNTTDVKFVCSRDSKTGNVIAMSSDGFTSFRPVFAKGPVDKRAIMAIFDKVDAPITDGSSCMGYIIRPWDDVLSTPHYIIKSKMYKLFDNIVGHHGSMDLYVLSTMKHADMITPYLASVAPDLVAYDNIGSILLYDIIEDAGFKAPAGSKLSDSAEDIRKKMRDAGMILDKTPEIPVLRKACIENEAMATLLGEYLDRFKARL